ncbi:methionine--tRNA ligase [Candidatus Micrarchaeota archaeon]|nr:methionine--tRNA ligase [Candidatus Micrarchaeota archaeon]
MIKVRYLVTGALPYVNYDLHFGHVVACLLRPDIFTRFLKLKGDEAISICGSDEYGTPSLVAAEEAKTTPQKLCDKYHAIQKQSIEKLNIKFDNFSRTTTPEHIKVVQDFYYKLKQNNYIYRKEIEQLYCGRCERALPDRYVRGVCPYCGSENARGDQCESCGKPLEPAQLKNARCVTCGTEPVIKKEEHVFFELSKLNEQLLNWVEKNEHWPDNARNFALNWLNSGLDDKDISRDLTWGVPIPDADGLVFYVWFDAPLGYITFTKQIGKENWWTDKNTRIVHFIGKDNIVFHTIYFPGMLIANGKYNLPYQVSSCEFLNYEGGKFSKSEKRGVFLQDAVELYPADYWRYYLTTVIPDTHDSSFEWKEFQKTINNDLNDVIGNFVHRTLTFAQKFYDGKVEQPTLTAADKKVLKKIENITDESAKLLYDVQLKKALIEIVSLAREGNQFITAEEPWKNEKRRQNVVYVSLCISKALATLLEPFVPETSEKLKKYLNVKTSVWDDAKSFEKSFNIANDFKPLFKKIDDEEVKAMTERFSASKGAPNEKKGGKPMIKYDDFDKVELKIAVVKAAERVEKSDKLIKLVVDEGDGNERTVVAGLAEHYKPEEMVGKKIVLLANLEPRKMKGIESNGMLLAAEKDGVVSLLTVDKDVGAGAEIR